jgi:hypothetical protein
LESFGIAEGTALDMAAAMVTWEHRWTFYGWSFKDVHVIGGLAGDLASFKNISIDIANTGFCNFTGETNHWKMESWWRKRIWNTALNSITKM